jgi:hypothetical protein
MDLQRFNNQGKIHAESARSNLKASRDHIPKEEGLNNHGSF